MCSSDLDDGRTLAAGLILEKSLGKRDRRPNLEDVLPPDSSNPVLPLPEIEISDIESGRIRAIAESAGFQLTDQLYDLLAEAAPYAWAMGRRLDRDFGFSDEPMNIFVHRN
mgnify:CR=1 FL=1